MSKWHANPEFIFEGTGVFSTIAGRSFSKVNEGKAIVGVIYDGTYTGVMLLSTEPDAVTYTSIGQTFPQMGTIEYLGLTWYWSGGSNSMGGNHTPSDFAKKIDGTYGPLTDRAMALLLAADVVILSTKYLLCSNNIFYNIVDSGLNELSISELTSDVFNEYGNNEPPTSDILLELEKPSVYIWTQSTDTPGDKAVIKMKPLPQTVISEPIDLSHSSIKGIEKATFTGEGVLIMAISIDDKQSWIAHNGTEWITLSDEFSGMSQEQLESITVDQWSEVITDEITHIHIRVALNSLEQSVTEICLDFVN